MTQQNTGQVQFQNTMRPRVGLGRLGGIDAGALAKAEAALKSLSSNFAQWLNDEIVKLDAARDRVNAEGKTDETMESLYFRAHDLKGLGTTYGFAIVTHISGLLCKVIGDKDTRLTADLARVDTHIAAIKAAVAEGVTREDDDAGARLLQRFGV